jgi:hypothetical protein
MIEIDEKTLQPINTIVEIEYDSNVLNVNPIDVSPQAISFMKSVNASSNVKPSWINHEWVDLKSINNGEWSGSFWKAAEDDKEPWIEIDLGKTESIKKVVLYESGSNIRSYELQYREGDNWKTIHNGTEIGPKSEVNIGIVDLQLMRLVIKSFTGTPGIYEMMFFN